MGLFNGLLSSQTHVLMAAEQGASIDRLTFAFVSGQNGHLSSGLTPTRLLCTCETVVEAFRAAILRPPAWRRRRHIEAQMNSTKEDDRPKLIIAEPIEYLLEPLRESNPFTRIKANRISVLKEDLNKRRDAESQRFRQERDPAKKLPIELRQRYTAHAKVRELVKEEDHQELE
ncbi:unnamed protein product, partial [Protopolystoma xenopodis]